MYWLKVYEIPDSAPQAKARRSPTWSTLQPGEHVRAILSVRDLEEEGKYIFFATRNGTVKKTALKDFTT